mmetsp:Transcript_33681/g.77766  ORF Transcript_33681/g.77766 Transcript_33681/m.77766 type:complete len:264 (-) Transcript_33681:61-852(-)
MARLALALAGAASVLLALAARRTSEQLRPSQFSPAFVVVGPQGLAPAVRTSVQPIVPKQALSDGASATPARSGFGFLGLCAALTLPAVFSRITCRARWGQRKPNKPTDWNHERLGYRIKGGPGWNGSPHTWTERIRWVHRYRRRIHIRRKVEGTSARPRLAVFRSKMHMHASVIDDTIGTGITMIQVTTKQAAELEKIRDKQGCEAGKEKTWAVDAAEIIGTEVAKQCLEKGITMVVFDRAGFPYEGRVKAVAEAARTGGLQF